MLAVNSLGRNLGHAELVKFEAIAYATAGLGFALFFIVQGFHLWTTKKQKRYIFTPLLLAPVVFILGQLISISIIENIPDTLNSEQKGLALKSAMMLQSGDTNGIAPFFLEREHVSKAVSEDVAVKHYRKLSEYEAQLQIVAGVNFITELNMAYKHSQPAEKELRIYRSKVLSDFLSEAKYNLFDHRGVNGYVSNNPVEPNPLIDIVSDMNVLFAQNDLNFAQRKTLASIHINSKSEQYKRLLFNFDVELNKVDVGAVFAQGNTMDILERTYMLSTGFGVNEDVAKSIAKNDAKYALRYGMTHKMFESIIPVGFETKALSLGLSEKQFLQHSFMDDMIKVNAPIMKFRGIEFVPVHKLSDHQYAKSISDNIRQGLSPTTMNKVKSINTLVAIEMFEGGHTWEGLWAKNAMLPKLIPAVSMPIIILVSQILILINLLGAITLVGGTNKAYIATIAGFIILMCFVDLRDASEFYFTMADGKLEWLLDGLSNIGMKPSQVY